MIDKSPTMVIEENTREQLRPLWFASITIFLLSLFRLLLFFVEQVQAACEQYLHMPLANAIINGLFFWLLAILFVGYRHWHRAVARELELERVVASISPDVLIVVQPDRTISSCNTAVRSMFGYEPEEIVGGKTDRLYGDRRTDKSRPEIRECLENVGFHVGYATAKRRDGSSFPLEIVTGSLRGRPGAVVLMRDISQLREAQKRLLAAKEEAELATQAKTEALALLEENYTKLQGLELMRDRLTDMLVHDLKSPLATVRGYLDMIAMENAESGALSEDSTRNLAAASRVAIHLREMVLTLLDLSRLEKLAMDLHKRPTDLVPLVHEAAGLLGSEEAAAMVELEALDAQVIAPCDPSTIRRLIMNLLDNAVKFSPVDGKVRVTLSRDESKVHVAVSDSGPGVPEGFREKIFDHFAQVDARGYSTGIGLAFCRMAANAHGGDLKLDCPEGGGSTFTLSLPLRDPTDNS